MAYQIIWKAMSTDQGEITGTEEIEAPSALDLKCMPFTYYF